MPELNELEIRQIVSAASGRGLITRQSNHDKPEKRVQKLVRAGYLESSTKATPRGVSVAREYYEDWAIAEERSGRHDQAKQVRELASRIPST